jgi:predicted aspartyl protease
MAGYKEMKSNIAIINGLPFIQIKVWNKSNSILLRNVLVDTGSASTILRLDLVEEIGLFAEPEDIIGTISGVGGSEFVFFKTIETIEVNDLKINNFQVDIGIMDYGLEIDGIVGMDFLLQTKGIIDLNELLLICK